MKNRQRVNEPVRGTEAPALDKGQRVRRQVLMRQHRPFRAAGRARGVEDRRQIVACARDRLERGRRGGDSPGEGSIALHAEAFDPRQAELQRERPDRLELIGAAENERGLGVAEEIFEFGKRIGGVQRQEDRAGAKARERDHDHVGRFVDLRRDPVAGLDAKRDKRMSRLGRAGEKLAVSQRRGVGGLERELLRVRRPRGDEIEEIGGMRSRHLASSRTSRRAMPLYGKAALGSECSIAGRLNRTSPACSRRQ